LGVGTVRTPGGHLVGQSGQERRRHVRAPAGYPVIVRDSLARIAAAGRTENVSDGGFLLICGNTQYVPRKGRLFVEIRKPLKGGGETTERHLCRIAHVAARGRDELALGVQFLDAKEDKKTDPQTKP
jgi:hypothetical protein